MILYLALKSPLQTLLRIDQILSSKPSNMEELRSSRFRAIIFISLITSYQALHSLAAPFPPGQYRVNGPIHCTD